MNNKSEIIQQILEKSGLEVEIKKFPESTHTAQEAADVIGCTISQIAKSIIFKGSTSSKPVLIITSGSNRVDLEKVEKLINQKTEKADADFILEETGFVIGGVPPFGHKTKLTTFIDEDLLDFEEVWASAGTPNSVFKITPQDLIKITQSKVADIKKD